MHLAPRTLAQRYVVLALARAERRAAVTDNIRDFRPLHAEAVLPGGPGHHGVIFMPKVSTRFGRFTLT